MSERSGSVGTLGLEVLLTQGTRETASFTPDVFLPFLSVVVFPLQLGDGGQCIFYLNYPGDYEQA